MKRESLSREVMDRVEDELLAGEELLWAGRPAGFSGQFRSLAVMLGLIGALLIGAVAALLALMLVRGTAAPLGVVLMIITLAVIVAGAPVARAFRHRRGTVYAVTDRRALILNRNRVQSYGPRDIEFIERRMYRNGRGDILFARGMGTARTGTIGTPSFDPALADQPVGFLGMEEPRAVEALMLEVFRPVEVYTTDKPKRDEALPDESDEINEEALLDYESKARRARGR